MPQIILDTSVVVPKLDERDALRQPAVRLWTAMEQEGWEVIKCFQLRNFRVHKASVVLQEDNLLYSEPPFTRDLHALAPRPIAWLLQVVALHLASLWEYKDMRHALLLLPASFC